MKERPILFSGPMVKAILTGHKTQTRRLVKPQPSPDFLPVLGNYHRTLVDKKDGEQFPDPVSRYGASDENEDHPCPHGQPGDRLWVKETHRYAGGISMKECEGLKGRAGVRYRADGEDGVDRWRPSIFMPRWASRTTLEITAVRVELLQDITEDDAQAEGVRAIETTEMIRGNVWPVTRPARQNFRDLWWRINGIGSWETNPWVWVISFRRIFP